MPDLTLSDDSKQYQDLACDFAQKELAEKAHSLDRVGEFAGDIYLQSWQIGLMNVRLPEALGGLGLGVFDACVIAEELAAGCAGVSAAFWGNDLAVAPLMVAGSDAQQKRWLEPLASQFAMAGYCFPASQVSYSKSGSGFTLQGSAQAINAHLANWLLLPASDASGKQSLFIVEANAPSLKLGEKMKAIGLKAADLCNITCNDTPVSAHQMIGAEGSAPATLASARAQSYAILAAHGVGIMRSALQHSLRYSCQRRTMGTPIARHQAVALMLADIAKDTQAARFMVRKAAWMADHGQADCVQAVMAKIFTFDAAMKATTDAVQIFGGYGYSREYPVEKLMRDAKMMQVLEYEGAQERIAVASAMTSHG